MYLWTSWTLHLQLGTSKLYLEPLLKTFETPGAFIWNPYLEPWNLPKLYLRTFAGNLDRHLEPSRTYTLTWMEPICFTWNLGIFRNLLEPLLGTSEPSGTLYDWNPYLEPRNLPEPLLGTLILGTSEPSEPYLEPLLGTSEPAGTFTWNPYTWNLGTFGTLLGTLTWNLGTCRNLYLEPLLGTSEPAGTFTWNPYLEPRSPPEPLLGTLTWNLGTCQNLAGWLPQSAPGLSLARTPKLSAVGEKHNYRFRFVCLPWAAGPLVLWSLVLWSAGPLVLWSPGPLVLWSAWSSGPLVRSSWSGEGSLVSPILARLYDSDFGLNPSKT